MCQEIWKPKKNFLQDRKKYELIKLRKETENNLKN